MLNNNKKAVNKEKNKPFEVKFGNNNWNGLRVSKNGLSVMENVYINIAYYYNNLFRKFFL